MLGQRKDKFCLESLTSFIIPDPNMSQLIVIPTLTEAQPLIHSAGFTQTDDPAIYRKEGSDWKLMIAGIGTVPVLYNLTKHFAACRYDKVIHAGIAGSYFLPLQPGEVVQVVRDTFVDVGIDHGGIFRWVFHENLWKPDEKPFHNGWMEVDADSSLKLEAVNGITVDLVTAGPERKARLAEKFNPQIESMEGAAVFYVCKMEDIPVIQIRAISNYVGVRDRHSWKTEEAIEALTRVISGLL
jgi:futalosine hydrolase